MKRYIVSAVMPLEDESFDTKYYSIAQDPNARATTLARLAKDPEWFIRAEVAKNPSTSSETLSELAHDPESSVRFSAAKNPNTPVSDLMQLAGDPDEHVHSAVAGNPSTPTDILEALSHEVGRIDEHLTRYWVACNPNTPLAALRQLKNDWKEPVRQAAQKTILEVYGREALY